MANLGAFMLGGFAGYTIGTSLGVYSVASTSSYNASFGNIVLGNVLGSAASIGVAALVQPSESNAGTSLFFALPIIGGMVANSLSIEKQSSPSAALINISNDKSSVVLPSTQMRHTCE